MLTVKSAAAVDEFLGAVERIDQEEGIAEIAGMTPAATSSSATQGMSGNAARRPARMIFSLARSASVTGELSDLRSTAQPA